MERLLTDKEKIKIDEICKTKNNILESYASIIKIAVPILSIVLFVFLYSQIKLGTNWIYIGIAIIISIIIILEINKLQSPFKAIQKNNCMCIETTMNGSRKLLLNESDYSIRRNDIRVGYEYYIIANINDKSLEIEYMGNNFDRISIGEKIVAIKYNKNKYVCFSYDEINN